MDVSLGVDTIRVAISNKIALYFDFNLEVRIHV
jgi:hypothetical protein